MQNHSETSALLCCIKNMVFGIGLMVFSLGLLTFGYFFFQNTAGFAVIYYGSAILFLLGAIWWWGTHRPSSPESNLQDAAQPTDPSNP